MGFFEDENYFHIYDEELEDIDKSYSQREFVNGNGRRKSYWRTRTYEEIEGKENNFQKKYKHETEEEKIERYLRENSKILTDKNFIDLSKKEVKKLVNCLRNSHTYTTEGIKVAYGRFEKNSKKTNEKELKGAKILRDIGLEIFLLPNRFAVDKNNNERVFGDAIVLNHNHILDFKQVDGKNPGRDWKKATSQGHDVLLYVTSEMDLEGVKSSIDDFKKHISKNRDNPIITYIYLEKPNEIFRLKYDKIGNLLSQKKKDLNGDRASTTKATVSKSTLSSLNRNRTVEQVYASTISQQNNLSRKNSLVNKSIEINITDITEGNRFKKFEQLEKCLSGGIPEYVPADNTPRLGTINIKLKDYSSERIEKALRTMAMSLSVPLKAAKGEIFFYKAQEDLTDKWCMFFSGLVRNTYDYVTECLDLPKKTVMSKSDILTHKGRILYNPSTGEPIKQADWNKFVNNLEKFLNRNIKDVEKKIILESKSLSKILDRMLKYNTLEAVKKLRLNDVSYHGKSFDWISENVKNMQNVFGESLTRQEQARIEVMTQSAAQEITNITDKMRGNIKQILIDGVKGKRSKGQVSQALFDKMVGDNRDFQRVADTEIQDAFNNSFVQEEVYNTEEGKKTYFKRIEVIDGNTCPKCKAINGKIAVWSDKPLNDEKSKDKNADYVIWEGKDGFEWECPISVKHPYCRGIWQRYDIGLDNINIDALVAEQSKNAKKWNNAVKAAKEEYKEKGIENPDDSTKGFTDRIQEIFNSEDVQKSLFTDWKVELHHLCEEKGLDYDSIIQKYDDKLTRFVAEEQLGQDAENVIAYKAYKDLNKSLTWSGHKLQGRTTFNGLNISIENKKGSIRRGVDSDGHEWAIKMHYDYGYIRGTEGVDGDHVDCYLGGNEDAKNVYIIHQKIPGTDKYDEDKCMLGFDTLADAKAAYLKQYDRPGFFGGADTVPFEVFKQKVLLKKWHGKKLILN